METPRSQGDARADGSSGASEVTRLLQRFSASGGGDDAERLLELIYGELRGLAAKLLSSESAGHTLQPTALVHEAYLRLVDQSEVEWRSRAHFFAIAAQAMRRILVDHARAQRSEKRGFGWQRVELPAELLPSEGAADEVLEVDAALEGLRRVSERQARVVELRYFGGYDAQTAAAALGVSLSTVEREWRFARAWLASEIRRTAQ